MFEDIIQRSLWVLFLFPGFISVLLAQYLADISDVSETKLLILGFGLNLINIVLAIPIWMGIAGLIRLRRRVDISSAWLGALFVIVVLGTSSVVGVAGAALYENDALLKLLRASPTTRLLSKRSFQRPLTFLLVQNRKGQLEEGRPVAIKATEAWIEVHLTNGDVFAGWPEFFSIGSGAAEIFLSPACQRVRNESAVKVVSVPGPGVLIFEKDIRFILFVDKQKSECQNIWKSLARK